MLLGLLMLLQQKIQHKMHQLMLQANLLLLLQQTNQHLRSLLKQLLRSSSSRRSNKQMLLLLQRCYRLNLPQTKQQQQQMTMRLLASVQQRSRWGHRLMLWCASAASLGRHLLRLMQQRQLRRLRQQQQAQMLLLLPLLLTWLHHSTAAGEHCVRLGMLWLLRLPWLGPFSPLQQNARDGCCLWVTCCQVSPDSLTTSS
jgi:hypothetical protein